MAGRKLEDRIGRLKQLRAAAPDESVVSALRKGLEDRSNLVAAEAAKIAGDLHLSSLVPDLLHAFDRLFDEPAKSDPKCWGKTAIARALTNLDYADSPPFLRGSQHVQMEPVYGGQEDAAPQLRATCVLALVQCADLGRIEVLRHLVNAMTDPADPVRLEAVRAIGQMNGDEAGLLLRLKAPLGDRRPLVIGEVFDAILNLEHEQAVGFIGDFFRSPDAEVRDEAALALGASRLPGAVDFLIKAWNESRHQEFGPILLRALSSSRQPSALEFLLDLVKKGSTREAAVALDALELNRDSPEVQRLVEQAKRIRGEAGN